MQRSVHFVGRFDHADPAGPRFSFAGSRLVTRFEGRALRVRLEEQQTNYYSVRVDGAEAPVLVTRAGRESYVLASDLPDGAHDLVLTRRTEGMFGITRFLGFEGAPLVPTPPPYRRFIEIVGDSVSNGYGVLAPSPTSSFGPATESEPNAYGALAAEELGAGHATIAYSGKGIFQNYGATDEPLMSDVYGWSFGDDASRPWDPATGYVPDAIVVSLGANDYWAGDPGDGFARAHAAFLRRLRGLHANAWIVVTLAPVLGGRSREQARRRLRGVVDAAGARVAFLEFEEQRPEDGLGADEHPGRVTQRKMAAQLVATLRELLGW